VFQLSPVRIHRCALHLWLLRHEKATVEEYQRRFPEGKVHRRVCTKVSQETVNSLKEDATADYDALPIWTTTWSKRLSAVQAEETERCPIEFVLADASV
jgi:hypothetical protein